ncbi:MAG: Type secretion system ATPase TadZ/CpaE, associated with Flp pilus assembly [Frankiales bacterium]|nr:Type secretion system ATPase TadZ/CpaE, associated with Flp pilus assembly [Frankiales bacterium]
MVVLDRSDALVAPLIKAIEGLDDTVDVNLFTKAAEVEDIFLTGPVDVLLVGPSEMTPTGLRRVAKWHAAHPSTVVMVACEDGDLPDPKLLMRAGAEQLLKLPAGPAAVRRALLTALGVMERQKDELATVIEITPEPVLEIEEDEVLDLELEEEPEPEPEPEVEVQREPGVTITVSSATGGCGKTFLATNLAYLLAQGTGKRVAMIDLDLQFGEVVATLHLKPTRTIADVELDDEGNVEIAPLMTHHKGGFDVLAAPPDPVAAEGMGPATIAAVIDAVRMQYDYILIDTPPSLNEVVLGAFDVSDHLLVLATLDIPSVRNMRVFLTTLDRLRISTEGLHLILNKAEKGVELTADDIQRVLGRSWDLELPYDKEVSRSVNLGLPVSESAPRAEVSRRLVAGVPALLPEAEMILANDEPEGSMFARLFAKLRKPRKSAPPTPDSGSSSRTTVLAEEKTS